MSDAQTWIDRLNLDEHPEGGYYRETYRARESIPETALPPRFDDERHVAALIYFLLPSDSFSAFHRIQQDEIWHFYAGDPVVLHQINQEGMYRSRTLSRHVADGHALHTVVPAGTWFGATVSTEEGFTLVGCTTAPAFDFADFELADRDALVEEYPQYRSIIRRLTRSDEAR